MLGEPKPNKQKNINNIRMEHLKLDEGLRTIIKTMLGFKDKTEDEENKDIENFVKENIGEEYSYHQVQTFIKLFISQYKKFPGKKIIITDSNERDITKKCIDDFTKATKYFTNSGFSKLLMKIKDIKKIDKFDLCLKAYQNDLNNKEFKTLFYVDPKTRKCRIVDLGETVQINKKQIKNKEVDIIYLFDATGSMGPELGAANQLVIRIFNDLKKKFEENNLDFKFGIVYYGDELAGKRYRSNYSDKENGYFDLTNDMNKLQKNISTVKPDGGWGEHADWVAGYDLALNRINWRNGSKLIIHIADDGAHGEEFSKGDKFPEQGDILIKKIKECVNRNINIIGFKIGNEPEQSFEKLKEINDEYKISIGKNSQFVEIYEFNRDKVQDEFYTLVMEAATEVANLTYHYLKKLKDMLDLPNDIEDKEDKNKSKNKNSLLSLSAILELNPDKDEKEQDKDKQDKFNYVITDDNYKKMVLLIYRIQANIPVIIMGETGCGKTALIKKLNQILNNGKNLVKTQNIHPGITDEDICEFIKKINKEAKDNNEKEYWVFFDEINTCLSFTLLTEIFINRTFNGEKLEGNIRLIGACNPYRKKNDNTESCGLIREDDENDKRVYKVNQLPFSLLYYVFSFGTITKEDEEKYIGSIIEKLFNLYDIREREMHRFTKEAISECHSFLRESFNEPSIVSLREISRFVECVKFFKSYFEKKGKADQIKISKINSIICSIYICYYIRIINDGERSRFNQKLNGKLLDIINSYSEKNNENDDENNQGNLLNKVKYIPVQVYMRKNNIQHFDEFLEREEDFLLEQIELDKGIGKNQLLKENIFLLFLSVVTKIPLIIVGKPGTGKSLSAQLIYNSMRGKYSKSEFFKNYPEIYQIYFQGSESTSPEEVEKLFEDAKKLCKNSKNKNQNTLYMILFDELGLAEKSPTNPLKVLHANLEYSGNKDGICFIGISNYSLDPAKVNRAFYLSVPNLESLPDRVKETAKSIVESISSELTNDDNIKIFNIISEAYYLYKDYLILIKELIVLKQYYNKIDEKDKNDFMSKTLKEIKEKVDDEGYNLFKELLKKEKKIKTEFHGNRDFYNIIKGVALEGSKLSEFQNDIVPFIESYIERNFGGISYEIDIDFKLELKDISQKFNNVKNILKGINKKPKKKKDVTNKENIKKVSSVYLFKKIYNLACEEVEKKLFKQYQINENNMINYNLNKCINDNINDNNGRYLLLEIKPNLSALIVKNIKIENPEKKDIEFINGSQFSDDNNKDYKYSKVNEIQEYADQPDKLIILQNLNQIQAYLYDVYNMNYKIIDEQKYARICLDNFEQLTRVSDSFRIIILVDKKFINSVDNAFLNRLEKIQIHFSDLLDDKEKLLVKEIIEEIKLKEYIKEEKSRFNYDLNNLIINCGKEEIGGLVYNSFIEKKGKKVFDKDEINDIKAKIYNKISYLLPQDIIMILPKSNELRKKYESKNYNNLEGYLKDLNSKIIDYKISIIYTFSGIADHIEGFDNNDMEFMISEISKESQLKEKLDEIINRNSNKGDSKSCIILIHFEQFNSNKIQFVSDYIMKYNKDYDLKKDNKDNYKYIFIIHVQRIIIFENEGNNELKNKQNTIYSIPNIDNDINQLFIDNLNGLNISLSLLLNNDLKEAMKNNSNLMNLDEEFNNSLLNFVYEEMKKKRNSNILNETLDIEEDDIKKYYDKIEEYMKNDKDFKKEIIKKVNDSIDIDTKSLFDKMLEEKNINKKSIDIISCILKYYKENIFKENLYSIFKVLEDNNILTTLIETKNKNNKLDNNIINELKKEILKLIKIENKIYEPKFLFNYKIPGFYNFYKNLSYDINNNISIEYFNNEKKLREYFDDEPEKMKKEFHKKEELLLNLLIDISQDKYKFYFDIMKKILEKSPDLIIDDYITFYLDKYFESYTKSSNRIIKLLLKLRFSSEKNEIIKKNEYNSIAIILVKIMWIESNVNYIKNIINIFNNAKEIIINDNEGNKLYKMIEDLIDGNDVIINYIVDENRNPEHTTEVNECFYKILASLCLNLTSNKIKLTKSMDIAENIQKNELEIIYYNDQLKIINNILQILNYDLILYLNEIYIIDEFIRILDYKLFKGKINIINIEKIRNNLRESSVIIQKNQTNKIKNLRSNFINLYDLLKEEEIEEKYKKEYYDTLKYIFLKEIKKVNDLTYRANIINILINEKEIIKNSNDIFQIILYYRYLYNPEYKKAINNLLLGKDETIINIESNLNEQNDNYFELSETLIYFFEKNSLIYLQKILNKETLEGEPKNIFKDSIKYLNTLLKNPKEKSLIGKLVNITKLFCFGYIKAFCFTFIKMNEKGKIKPDNIIEIINSHDIKNMIKLYIYKIIYNLNDRKIDVFMNETSKEEYKLYKYNNFNMFIKFNEEDEKEFNNGIKTLDNDNYNSIYNILLKNKNDNKFNNIISNREINSDGKLCFDNFYVAACYLVLSDLKKNDEFSENYKNFYKNVCEPLNKKEDSKDKILINDKLLILIQFLFDPSKFSDLKKNNEIKPKDIEALLYGYRYCLNEIAEEYDDEDEGKIFSVLYDMNKLNYLSEKLFPGSDTEDKQYYDLYYQIENHFEKQPNAGCYICLCDKDKGYYHSISSGFPRSSDNSVCPICGKEIGAKEKYTEITNDEEKINIKIYEPIKRDNYFRIFKDEQEVNAIKNDKSKKYMLKVKNMTKEQFKEKYIIPLYKQEKGLHKINENKFKKDDKVIRNLNQISYRLLNYILYSHLFFAKLYLDSKNVDTSCFDLYLPVLPKGQMTWINTINECFILLKKELSKIGIKQIEIFMNLIFVELFNKLHDKNCIETYDDLIEFENDLNILINNKIDDTKKEIERYKKIEEQNCKEKTSAIALLKETYNKENYDPTEYPYYEYFYYTDYIDEKYLDNILEHEDKNSYPILNKYLEYKRINKIDDDKYSINNLIIFNGVLNLFNEKYSNKIPKETGEKQILKDSDIYQNMNNIKSIDNFIKIYNNFKLEDKGKKLKLNANENSISDFFLYDDNKYGKSYKEIYREFIKKQNEKLEELLDLKIKNYTLKSTSKIKINIQQIKEKEIFTYDTHNNFNFTDIIFNSSYRKIIDTKKYEDYNEFIIDLNSIETRITDSLLKGKKLLKNELIEFRYNDEVFSNEIDDVIFNFEHKYTICDINIKDKVEIYNYVIDNKGNNEKYRNIITDFFTLMEYLIKINKNNYKGDIGNTQISEIIKNIMNISKDFKDIFKDKNDDKDKEIYLTVNKTSNIFSYYLKLIFKYIKEDIEKYQEKGSAIDKNKINSFFSKKSIINKESLANAIRMFISVVLYREKDKDKIKTNKKNIIGYLHKKDLWENKIYTNEKFEKNIDEIKSFKIAIKEILWFYNLINDVEEDYEKDVIEYLQNIQKEEEKSEENDEETNNQGNNINKEEDSGSDFALDSDDDDNNNTNTRKRAD